MIRLLFLLIIAAIVLGIAFLRFKNVSIAKKMTAVGGALAAAAVGILLQSGFTWYMPVLALIGISLAATLIYMKLEEREELEKKRLAEERKERRQSGADSIKKKAEAEKIPSATPSSNKISLTKEAESIMVRETVLERQTIPASIIPQPEKIHATETVKLPEEDRTIKSFGMQSIQPVGKER